MSFRCRFGWYQSTPDAKLVKVWISDSAWITGETWYLIHFSNTKTDWVRASHIIERSK